MTHIKEAIKVSGKAYSWGDNFNALKEFFGIKPAEANLKSSLEEVIEEHASEKTDQSLSDDERTMLRNILEYGELRVDDVMVPRVDVVAIPNDTNFDDLTRIFASAGHSRLPVYKDTLDDIIGMVHVKDAMMVIAEKGQKEAVATAISSFQRPVLFVPAAMKLLDLLAKMRSNRMHMAIVVDEYGGTDGLVTIEDLVEEIVGEIEDEHDTADIMELKSLGQGNFDADARLEIDFLQEELGVDLLEDEEEDVDTLGGLVVAQAGRVPEIGEVINHASGYRFEVVDASPRTIYKLRIYAPDQ